VNNEFERIWKEVIVTYLRPIRAFLLERLMRTMKNLRIAGVPAEIQTEYFQNTYIKYCHYTILLGDYANITE
jgi:hypothetical protein